MFYKYYLPSPLHDICMFNNRSHTHENLHSILTLRFFRTLPIISLQKQVSVMSMNLSAKLDELQRGDRHLETTVALCEIRTQLQELTKSVESCQSEVSEVKRDMVAIKHELDTVQQVKEEIEELREYVDRLEEHTHRRKLRLLEQVCFT